MDGVMFYYIKGIVMDIQNNFIILENNDIGYIIYLANTNYFDLKQKIKIFTYCHIKEEKKTLYGFLEKKELDFFHQLIKIPGIGPKNAMIISEPSLFNETQKAIQNDDIAYLIKFPGIGTKTAQQIIFHWKNNHFLPKNIVSSELKDIQTALNHMGFSIKQIKEILPQLTPNKNLESMLKEALQLLGEKKDKQIG
ncbi:MAG: Holliday junction branch migration protein RuvA [Vigna little leaf phytoplasma]|nr:Holliday junction branch migration protein RuvA [Vigna little leaf phytoplasma]